jgi:hypothetical protein
VTTHVLTTPPELREAMKAESAAYVDDLADFVVRAAGMTG